MTAQRLRALAWLLCSLPLVWLIYATLTRQLGANPVEYLEHETGFWALVGVCASLAITPLRLSTGLSKLAPLRRTLGLFGFFYAALHVLVYALLDRSLLWSELMADLTKRPYVMLGFAAFVGFAALAATSPKWAVRKLGGLRWRQLHRLVYVAVPLAVAHFWWVKVDKNLWQRPAVFAAVVVALLLWRWWNYRSSSLRS